MRFTVPFLLAIAVYTATVLGANQTSFTPNEDMLYDIVSASDAIAFRLERALGIAEQPALFLGAVLLTIPALLTFHLFRIGFGGSVQSLIQEERMSRQLAQQREQAAAARYAAAHTGAVRIDAKSGDVLSPQSRAGDHTRSSDSKDNDQSKKTEAPAADGDNDTERRRGLKANLAAALTRRAGESEKSTSGTTSLSASSEAASKPSGLKDRWAGMLENRPDFSRLKSGAQSLKEKVGSRASTTKLSLDDIADDAGKTSGGS